MPARHVGIVRMREAHGQAERPRILAPGELKQFEFRLVGNLIVEFQLIADLGDSGLRDRTEVVIPPVDALERPLPVRRLAEIGRVDVGC